MVGATKNRKSQLSIFLFTRPTRCSRETSFPPAPGAQAPAPAPPPRLAHKRTSSRRAARALPRHLGAVSGDRHGRSLRFPGRQSSAHEAWPGRVRRQSKSARGDAPPCAPPRFPLPEEQHRATRQLGSCFSWRPEFYPHVASVSRASPVCICLTTALLSRRLVLLLPLSAPLAFPRRALLGGRPDFHAPGVLERTLSGRLRSERD